MSTPPSPSLVVVSPHSDRSEKRRLPRVWLTHEVFRSNRDSLLMPVVDLSEAGLGLRLPQGDGTYDLPVATRLEGTLSLGGEHLHVRLKVAHLGPHRLGCEFVELTPSVKGHLKSALQPDQLGRDFRLMPLGDLATRWYHGRLGTELKLHFGGSQLPESGILFFYNHFVEWGPQGRRTGSYEISANAAITSGEDAQLFGWDSIDLRADAQIDPQKLEVANRIIVGSNLPQELVQFLVDK